MMIKAKLSRIPTNSRLTYNQRGTEIRKISEYARRLNHSLPPPILAVKKKTGIFILDGYHRFGAARKKQMKTIRAWIIAEKDFKNLLNECFNGSMPDFFGELDDYVKCGKDNGYPHRCNY
jgi:hypothetical protein